MGRGKWLSSNVSSSGVEPTDARRTYYEALFTLEQSSAVEAPRNADAASTPVQKRTDWQILM